jgi:ABC-2 type transport system permease protein
MAPTVSGMLWPRFATARNAWRRGSRGEKVSWALLTGLGLLLWAGLFGLAAWVIRGFYGVEVFGPIITRTLLELLVAGFFPLLTFSNVVMSLSTFYLSDDLDLVRSLPVTRQTFHFARLAESMFRSSWMAVFFGLPLVVAYGLAYEADWVFVFAVAAVIPGFVAIPAGAGLLVSSLLVRFFPARRIRDATVLLGIGLIVSLFLVLRVLRPERLADEGGFESVAAYVASLQDPVPLLLPPRWITDVVLASLTDKPLPWLSIGLLWTGAISALAISRWVTTAVYDEGCDLAQEARVARLAGAAWMDAPLRLLAAPLHPRVRPFVVKDVKSFVRDPAQWSQLILVCAVVAIALVSATYFPRDVIRGQGAVFVTNIVAFASHGMVGFILATVATRFQFPAVSGEARSFWLVRTAPIEAEHFLWAKLWPALPLLLILGEALAIPATLVFGAQPFTVAVGAYAAVGLSFGISGIAVGMGAIYPDFKAENAAKVASGPTAMLFMVFALLLVAGVMLLEAGAVGVYLRALWQKRPLSGLDYALIAASLGGIAALCATATILPIKKGAASLWSRELPNS